jgi:hypothetical protein
MCIDGWMDRQLDMNEHTMSSRLFVFYMNLWLLIDFS